MSKIARFVVGLLETNCYVISSEKGEESVIIDPGGNAKAIEEYLNKNNKKPVACLCTHGHFDHILDAKKWQGKGAKIYLHKNDLGLFTEEEETFPGRRLGYPTTTPDVYVKENDSLAFGEMKFRVVETPGHTQGGVCYILDDQYIFAGDTIFLHSYGRTDLGGGDFGKLVDSVNKILRMEGDRVIYPGHGETTTQKEERYFNPLYNYENN